MNKKQHYIMFKIIKKTTMLIAFVGMFTLGYSQDVQVSINNQEASTKVDCAYRINGICSTEDIGGVDVEIKYYDNNANNNVVAVFKNYNSLTVTVLYEIGNEGSCGKPDGSTGNIVLPPNGEKTIDLGNCGKKYFYLRGIIVRKIKAD